MKIDLQPNKYKVGSRIRDIRYNNNKIKEATMEQFAELIGSGKSNVSKWERGENIPNYITLQKIASLASVSPEYILYGEPAEFLSSLQDYSKEYINTVSSTNKEDLWEKIYIETSLEYASLSLKQEDYQTIQSWYENKIDELLKKYNHLLDDPKRPLTLALEDLVSVYNKWQQNKYSILPENRDVYLFKEIIDFPQELLDFIRKWKLVDDKIKDRSKTNQNKK